MAVNVSRNQLVGASEQNSVVPWVWLTFRPTFFRASELLQKTLIVIGEFGEYTNINNLIEIGWKWNNIICYLLMSLAFSKQGNIKKSKKGVKVVNIEEENLYLSWRTWWISMKFLGNMWLMKILKAELHPVSRSSWKNHLVGSGFKVISKLF